MTARIVPLESEEHGAMAELLPWFANGTLPVAEMTRFESHLQTCGRCQSEVAWQRRLQEVTETPLAPSDADRGWSRLAHELRPQKQAQDLARPAITWRRRARTDSDSKVGWWGWAIAAQLACVVVLSAWIVLGEQAPLYRTLGAASSNTAANVLIVFRPEATESQIRQTLRAQDATLVGGPTVTDAYLARVPPLHLAKALEQWRTDPSVSRAESFEPAR